jgi:hypothetical protein
MFKSLITLAAVSATQAALAPQQLALDTPNHDSDHHLAKRWYGGGYSYSAAAAYAASHSFSYGGSPYGGYYGNYYDSYAASAYYNYQNYYGGGWGYPSYGYYH